MPNNKHQIVMIVPANNRYKNICNSVGTKTARFCLIFLIMMKIENSN